MKISFTTIILSILLTVSCIQKQAVQDNIFSKENSIESGETADMEQSIQLIMSAGNLDLDSAQGAMETLNALGISSIKEAERVPNNSSVVLQIIDTKNNIYYLGFGTFGYLEIVRKDSLDGEIIYAPME